MTSIFYLTPIVAVALEYLLYGEVPSVTSAIGVALVARRAPERSRSR